MKRKIDSTATTRLQLAVTEINIVLGELAGQFTVQHLEAAEEWIDRLECLKWAVEANATVQEMKVWRRAKNGFDLFSEAKD
jgi:hypothetical protein